MKFQERQARIKMVVSVIIVKYFLFTVHIDIITVLIYYSVSEQYRLTGPPIKYKAENLHYWEGRIYLEKVKKLIAKRRSGSRELLLAHKVRSSLHRSRTELLV